MQLSTKPVSTKTAASVLSNNERQKQTVKAKVSNATDKNTVKKTTVKKSESHAGSGLTTSKIVGTKNAIKPKIASTNVKTHDKPAVNKKNVMNMIHNVTVSSPPASAGKERSTSLVNIRGSDSNDERLSQKHSRTRTRTIAPEESILYQRRLMSASQSTEELPKVEKKTPVAYEINFEDERKTKKINKKSDSNQSQDSMEVDSNPKAKPVEKENSPEPASYNEEDHEYESDFESYESDFETEPSEDSTEKSSEESDSDDIEVTKISSQEKQIQQRIDSGSFDMSAKKSVTPTINQYDSIEDTVYSHDSGISYDDLQALNKRLLSPKVREFYRRGEELMKKIAFDNINFDIFEQKPIPYEVFMSVYGQRGMMQASTQCESFSQNEECQTDVVKRVNSWTQYPAKFTKLGLETVNSKLYNEEKLGVGEENFEHSEIDTTDSIEHIDMSIEAINNFSTDLSPFSSIQRSSDAVTDIKNFISNACATVLNILEGNTSKNIELSVSKIPISFGQFEIKYTEIEALKNSTIIRIWSSLCLNNYLITIHKSNETNQNLLCLWNILHVAHPLKILSSWCSIKCIEVHPDQRDFLVAGCDDGTICLWNMRERSSFNEPIQPCEIISLSHVQNDFTLDNVAALKSLLNRPIRNTISIFTQSHAAQFCSLHENGIVSIWTLLPIEGVDDEMKNKEMEFIHHANKVKLIKNISIDLSKFLVSDNNNSPQQIGRRKSAFEKTRYYFENDLFNDKILKELQEIDSERLQKSKNFMYRNETFTAVSFDLNFNELFVASDANFIVALSRLCLGDKARKIITNESNFISPAVLRSHPIDRNILAIGQTNGNVKFIKTSEDSNVNSSRRRKQLKRSNAAFSNDENVLAKSCAFQNIVEREKKLYDETQALKNLESDEMKVFMLNENQQKIENEEGYKNNLKIGFDKNVFNSFDVAMGPVKLIEFSKMGQFMFVVINKELKIFDCWKNQEIQNTDNRALLDVKNVYCSDGHEYLVSLLNITLIYALFNMYFFFITDSFDIEEGTSGQ